MERLFTMHMPACHERQDPCGILLQFNTMLQIHTWCHEDLKIQKHRAYLTWLLEQSAIRILPSEQSSESCQSLSLAWSPASGSGLAP